MTLVMKSRSSRSGFTLMETLLSVTVLAILVTTFLAVFGPATNTIRRSISSQEADRLTAALESELSSLSSNQQEQFSTAFDKAFEWIQSSSNLSSPVIVFNYRADISNSSNGIFEPYQTNDGQPGRDYTIQPFVGQLGSSADAERFIQALEGQIYVVRMRQLVQGANGLSVSGGGDLVSNNGGGSGGGGGSSSFTDAVIAFQADFFESPASSFQFLTGPMSNGGSDFEGTLGVPLFSRNLSVRR